MNRIRRTDLDELLTARTGPCVSLFTPLTLTGRDSRGDEISLRDLCDQAETQLNALGMRRTDVSALLEPVRALPSDIETWPHRGTALAAFAAPGFMRSFHTKGRIETALFVDDQFHLRPLLPLLGEVDRFFVLALSPNAVRMLEGDSEQLAEVPLPELPRALDSALNIHNTSRHEEVYSGQRGSLGAQPGVMYGQGGGSDYLMADLRSYYRVVADVIDRRLNGEHAPLILATVEATVPIWRQFSRYKFLLDDYVKGNPDFLTAPQLHARAWPLVEPALSGHRQWCEKRILETVGSKVTSDLRDIVPAAIGGRVAALFIDCHRSRWGQYDPANHVAVLHSQRQPGDQDLVELAAVETMRNGGDVFDLAPGEGAGTSAEALLRF